MMADTMREIAYRDITHVAGMQTLQNLDLKDLVPSADITIDATTCVETELVPYKCPKFVFISDRHF